MVELASEDKILEGLSPLLISELLNAVYCFVWLFAAELFTAG